MLDVVQSADYKYEDPLLNSSHRYLLPAAIKLLDAAAGTGLERRVFDLGCGNGSVSAAIAERGYKVTGVDPSERGVALGQARYPKVTLLNRSGYDDLAAEFGTFPLVTCLEVIEHVYYPRKLLKTAFDLVQPGGVLCLSTPFHGYLKNLLLALSGHLDRHFDVLEDNGHIKFFSVPTLRRLLVEAGFTEIEFHLIGRMPVIAKSMMVTARRPR
ncbi:MAG: methyltransferase domain-containing protein [Paracraurococcus sp.]